MKKQIIVRTYPVGYVTPTCELQKALKNGYRVIMSNTFDLPNKQTGNEYILEKDFMPSPPVMPLGEIVG